MTSTPMPDTPAFDWSDTYLLGHGGMDDAHREFVALVDDMLRCDDDRFTEALDAFAAHAERHFGDEDRWMAESGYENARCHVDEHRAVLASVREVRALPDDKRTVIGRDLARELARWFPGHADVMDQGLAKFLVRRRLGGAPITLRKRAASA